MKKKLSDIKIGDKCVVTFVYGEGKIRRRLFDMGVTPTAQIIVIKRAPFGDPIQINIRGYELTLRKDEAKLVEVVLMKEDKK